MKHTIKKPGLCLFLALVLAFLFTVPAWAAETVVDLSETSVTDDLGTNAETRFPAGSDVSPTLISYAATVKGGYLYHYFYFNVNRMNLTGLSAVKLSICRGDRAQEKSFAAWKFDVSGHFAKVVLRTDMRYLTAGNPFFYLRLSTWTTDAGEQSFAGVAETISGGSVAGDLLISYDMTTRKIQYFKSDDVLSLDVRLACERVSTSDIHTWTQINTAMFTVPDKYFDQYGKLTAVSLMYDLYDGVPMVCTTNAALANAPYAQVGTVKLAASGTYSYLLPLGEINNGFMFYRESIGNGVDDGVDFTGAEVLEKFDYYMKYGRTSADAVGPYVYDSLGDTQTLLSQLVSISDFESISTSSFNNSASFWDKLFNWRWSWNTTDDSVTNLSKIQTFDPSATISAASADKLSTDYVIDKCYTDDLKALNKQALASDSTVVLLRYLLTDYTTYDFNGYIPAKSGIDYKSATGYYCRQAIIKNFEIISLTFTGIDRESGDIVQTTVETDTDPVDWAGGGESGDKLISGIATNPFANLFENLFNFSGLGSAFRILLAVLVAVALILLVVKVIKLIAYVRLAFERRRRDPDKKKT